MEERNARLSMQQNYIALLESQAGQPISALNHSRERQISSEENAPHGSLMSGGAHLGRCVDGKTGPSDMNSDRRSGDYLADVSSQGSATLGSQSSGDLVGTGYSDTWRGEQIPPGTRSQSIRGLRRSISGVTIGSDTSSGSLTGGSGSLRTSALAARFGSTVPLGRSPPYSRPDASQ